MMIDSISEIKPGMIVKSKGSVIPMSVNTVDGQNISCYWFNGHVLNKSDFHYKDLDILMDEVKVHSLLTGNQVMLKSGSPLMTVESIEFKNNRPHATCSWKADHNHYLKNFNFLALQKMEG